MLCDESQNLKTVAINVLRKAFIKILLRFYNFTVSCLVSFFVYIDCLFTICGPPNLFSMFKLRFVSLSINEHDDDDDDDDDLV